jgi:HEAT repeat protein
MTRRVLRVVVTVLLNLVSLTCEAGGQAPFPLPITAQPAPPASGWPPRRRLPLAEERLTKADIPFDLPRDLKEELAGTFDADAKARGRCAEAIGKRGAGAAAAVPFLIRLLCDEAEVGDFPDTVSLKAWSALAHIGRPAVEPCISALKRSSAEPREALILALGSIRDPRAIDPLASLFANPNPSVRCQLVWALQDFDDRRVVPPLLRALKDDDDRVRQNAADALASHRDPQAVGPLIACLTDKDNVVRRNAAMSLGKQADPRAVPALLGVMRDPSERNGIRSSAARSLGQTGDASAHQALLVVLSDRLFPGEVRCGAAWGLGASGNVFFVRQLTLFATDVREATDVRAHAVDAIVRLQGKNAIPLLKSLVKQGTKDDAVRCSAAMPLVKLTNGAVEDVDTVSALRGPYLTEVRPLKATKDALQRIVENGKTAEVRAAAEAMLKERRDWRDWKDRL